MGVEIVGVLMFALIVTAVELARLALAIIIGLCKIVWAIWRAL